MAIASWLTDQAAFCRNRGVADRALGLVLGGVCGDALGAGFEMQSAHPADHHVPGTRMPMIGGGLGNGAPGEWTDDTAMAVGIVEAAAQGLPLHEPAALDVVAERFLEWFRAGPPDVGILTAKVLSQVPAGGGAQEMAVAAQGCFDQAPERSAGNGSLMRTAAVALGYVGVGSGDADDLAAQAAAQLSALTHADRTCQEACAVWTVALRHLVLGTTPQRAREFALAVLPIERQGFWAQVLTPVAQSELPAVAAKNGWVVAACQQAYTSAVTAQGPADVPGALEQVMYLGHDTDTVACIAGSWLGARFGATAFPVEWLDILHGWPGLTTKDLLDLVADVFRHNKSLEN